MISWAWGGAGKVDCLLHDEASVMAAWRGFLAATAGLAHMLVQCENEAQVDGPTWWGPHCSWGRDWCKGMREDYFSAGVTACAKDYFWRGPSNTTQHTSSRDRHVPTYALSHTMSCMALQPPPHMLPQTQGKDEEV